MFTMRAFAISIIYLCTTTTALSTPNAPRLIERQSQTCGGDDALQQCGNNLPSDFCCPRTSTCIQLETSAMAVLCCPAGQDCKFVSPINCDQTAQNATLLPGNQFHSDPTMPLEGCGNACCPVGATCHSGICAVQSATPPNALSPTSTGPASSSSDATYSKEAEATQDTSSSALPATTTHPSRSLDVSIPGDDRTSEGFSGKTFVAGLLPGIVLGILFFALLMWCLSRRRKSRTTSAYEKHFSTADQLTSLSTDPYRPPMHTRSISEPVSDPLNGHRTDFVRGTPSPPRAGDPLGANSTYTATAFGPITPARTPKVRTFLSRSSIFPTPPSPQTAYFPSHLKRGTLNHNTYTLSPIRPLRSKKSSHSLRRQMTTAATAPNPRQRAPTSASTETIQVLMPHVELEASTPDQRKAPPAQASELHGHHDSWKTVSSSPLFPEPIRVLRHHETPTRIPAAQARMAEAPLGSTQRPLRAGGQGLGVVGRSDERRQTTFSGFMEKAGIRPGG